MELIEIETGLFFDPNISLIEQSQESQQLFNAEVVKVMSSKIYDSGSKFDDFTINQEVLKRIKLLIFTYQSTTLNVGFKISYRRKYKHNPSTPYLSVETL